MTEGVKNVPAWSAREEGEHVMGKHKVNYSGRSERCRWKGNGKLYKITMERKYWDRRKICEWKNKEIKV